MKSASPSTSVANHTSSVHLRDAMVETRQLVYILMAFTIQREAEHIARLGTLESTSRQLVIYGPNTNAQWSRFEGLEEGLKAVNETVRAIKTTLDDSVQEMALQSGAVAKQHTAQMEAAAQHHTERMAAATEQMAAAEQHHQEQKAAAAQQMTAAEQHHQKQMAAAAQQKAAAEQQKAAAEQHHQEQMAAAAQQMAAAEQHHHRESLLLCYACAALWACAILGLMYICYDTRKRMKGINDTIDNKLAPMHDTIDKVKELGPAVVKLEGKTRELPSPPGAPPGDENAGQRAPPLAVENAGPTTPLAPRRPLTLIEHILRPPTTPTASLSSPHRSPFLPVAALSGV